VAEVVEHQVTGPVVPPKDFQGVLQAVVGLCEAPELRTAMGTAARQRCQQLFDIRNVAREYEGLFMRLLTGGRSPAYQDRDHPMGMPV
jgi:glycosyltransferase involved in cell wall biosynthesis